LPTSIRLKIVSPCIEPAGDGWLCEIKQPARCDHRRNGSLKLLSRNVVDWTPLFRSPSTTAL
jgi:hypothetical protein